MAAVVSAIAIASCERASPSGRQRRRPYPLLDPHTASVAKSALTGTVEAIHSSKVIVPQTLGQGGQLTLTHLIANGSKVQQGDLIAEFDPYQPADQRERTGVKGKYEDLNSSKWNRKPRKIMQIMKSEFPTAPQAQGDLGKAQLELQKAPILAEIARLENEVKADIAREHVASLTHSNVYHDQIRCRGAADPGIAARPAEGHARADPDQYRPDGGPCAACGHGGAAKCVARELQRSRAGRRSVVPRPGAGQHFRSFANAGPLLGGLELDGAAPTPGRRATVYFDAYPDLALPAHF